MTLSPISAALIAAKCRQGLSFAELGERLGRDEVWVASLLHGQATASEQEAAVLIDALGLEPEVAQTLTAYPLKGGLDP